MEYLKTAIVFVSFIIIASCVNDESSSVEIQACNIGLSGPLREVRFGQEVNSATCKLEGFKTEAQALASLRAAGACPEHIELRKNTNNGFPCTSFGPAYYFYAQIPEAQLVSAVNAGWHDRYSKTAINQQTKMRDYLLDKQPAIVLEPPGCDCSNPDTISITCSEGCLDYGANRRFRKEYQIEIDRINEYLLEAGKVTGMPTSCEQTVRNDLTVDKDEVIGSWGNKEPFFIDSSRHKTERTLILKSDLTYESIEYNYHREDISYESTKTTLYKCPKTVNSSLCSMWRSEKYTRTGTYAIASNVITLNYFDDSIFPGLQETKYHINRVLGKNLTLAFGAACQIEFHRQ